MDNQTKTETSTFNQRFKEARENARYTFPALAKETGIPKKTLEKFEYGGMEPNITRLQALSEALNVTVAYLTTGEENDPTVIEVPKADIHTDPFAGDPVIQSLDKLDELRENGFENSWRRAPRIFESVQAKLNKLTLDVLLDVSEARGLAMITDEEIEKIKQAEMDEHDNMMLELIERILDTAYIGFDLYTLTEAELKKWADHFELEGDDSFILISSWSGKDAILKALRPAWREAAMKGEYIEPEQ